MANILEVCCGSLEDAKNAKRGGANRIELNSALFMGGLTPSLGTLQLIKKSCALQVVSMVRPRGAGFCYTDEEYKTMLIDAKLLLEQGSDGIAFGFLKENKTVDMERTREMISLIKAYGKEAVFHRAFDVVENPYEAVEQLIELHCTRILTSGQEKTAFEGISLIAELQNRYGDKIDFVAGSGINEQNAFEIIEKTGISQVHSSCKMWMEDVTTTGKKVSYAFFEEMGNNQYDIVSAEKVQKLLNVIK